MLKSLWVKFLFLLLAVSVISLSATLILRELILSDFQEYLEGEREDTIYQVTAAVEGSYDKHSGWERDALQESVLWALLFGYEVKILDISDAELIDTNIAVANLSPLMKKRIIALSGFSEENIRNNQRDFTLYPLFLGGNEIGHLAVRFIQSKEYEQKETIFVQRSNRFLLITLFALGGVSLILSFIYSKRLTNPILKLTTAARDISEGHMQSKVSVTGHDELSKLTRTFNVMAESLEVQQNLRRRLAANVAHELRTPLTAIQGELEGMIDGIIPVDRERLLSLHEEAGRLKKIIEGMEELSRAEASVLDLKKTSIHFRSFLMDIISRFEKMFSEKGVRLELTCEDELTVFANPDKLSQIIINLVMNAFKATKGGDSVYLKADASKNEVTLEVADNGIGIKDEDIPFVFERFYKLSDNGLGLGLTITKELVEAHGGTIEVKSKFGEGSMFTVALPRIDK
jgi:two-component system sensor histidine kinase BaeS